MTRRFLTIALAVSALASAGTADAQRGKREPLSALPNNVVVPTPTSSLWVCDDGQGASFIHDVAAGVVRAERGGEKFVLQEQVGTNPQKFVTGNDTVVLDGDLAELRRGRDHRANCARLPDAPADGNIWGTLNVPAGSTLPTGARVKVMLVDAARADAPSTEIASTEITTRGNQPPLSYLLRFEPERAAPKPQTYRLQARIESAEGKLLFITDTALFVLEKEAATPPTDLTLVAVTAR